MPQKPHGLNDWMRLVGEIYNDRNRRKKWTHNDIWLHVVEEAAEIARDFRQEKHEELAEDLPDIFVWLCSFSNSFLVPDLEELVWYKFPGICPYCYQPESCSCLGRGYKYDREAPILKDARENREYQHYSLDEWEAVFQRIYGGINGALPHFIVGFHLLEELGEVARELRLGRREHCKEELADVIAWTFAIALKAKSITNLGEATWKLYPGVCKTCNENPCECDGDKDS